MKSVYIHIPFCSTICSYCDFCKMFYYEKYVDEYLKELEQEIKQNYNGEQIKTLYIGGGTPSCLNLNQLKKLFDILNIFKKDNIEFTFECNIEIEKEKLDFLKQNGVNRISVGIQTINLKHLKLLNRFHTKEQVINKINEMKQIGFDNINVDLMYAFPNQTIEELKKDLDFLISLNVEHISTYSLIIEPHTLLGINNTNPIDEDLDFEMYELICNTLKKHNYKHYEISNFAKNRQSQHNLTYWNNEEYYGFGLGASGYINGIRYENTRSFKDYKNSNYILESHKVTRQELIENAFILGFRKIEGISIKEIKEKYNIDIDCIDVINKLLNESKLIIEDDYIKINPKYIYLSNSILIDFIDFVF